MVGTELIVGRTGRAGRGIFAGGAVGNGAGGGDAVVAVINGETGFALLAASEAVAVGRVAFLAVGDAAARGQHFLYCTRSMCTLCSCKQRS